MGDRIGAVYPMWLGAVVVGGLILAIGVACGGEAESVAGTGEEEARPTANDPEPGRGAPDDRPERGAVISPTPAPREPPALAADVKAPVVETPAREPGPPADRKPRPQRRQVRDRDPSARGNDEPSPPKTATPLPPARRCPAIACACLRGIPKETPPGECPTCECETLMP